MANVRACLQCLPSVLYVTWHIFFLIFGVYATSEDWDFKNNKCGHSTHMMKYVTMNLVFGFIACLSYLFFPGGGEGARARAIVLVAFHFGFTVWGILMWKYIEDSSCLSYLNGQYQLVWEFHHMCIVYNAIFFVLFFLHESCLGSKIHNDFTLMAEISRHPHSSLMSPGSPPPSSGGYTPISPGNQMGGVPELQKAAAINFHPQLNELVAPNTQDISYMNPSPSQTPTLLQNAP